MSRLWLFVTAISALLVVVPTTAADELKLPPEKISAGSPGEMMRRYLLRQANQAAERWKEDYEKRKTPAEIAAYQKRMREECLAAIGGLPQRTPLEPQVTGTISRPGYRVEKVLF
ncbi:MAG: hypothetical protein KKE86_08845, partial [Planctomycetes bacterium]|nr:hypothetical protein [Planctomycetota bacterium]